MGRHSDLENSAPKLRQWCECVVDYILGTQTDPFSATMVSQSKKAIQEATEKQDLRGLRQIKRDFDEWAKYLDQGKQAELDSKLRSLCGEGLASYDKIVDKVLKKKRIRSSEEYQAVNYIIDQLCQVEEAERTEDHDERIERLSFLVAEYESELAKKGE